MQARMNNPAVIVPEALQALQALGKSLHTGTVSATILSLVHLRTSQINGCSVCVDMDRPVLKKAGETEERLFTVAVWRDAPYFTDQERAALALAEAITRLSDRPDAVSDEIWDEAARHFDVNQLAVLVLAIAQANLWNRLNASTRQIAGEWAKSTDAKAQVEKALAESR